MTSTNPTHLAHRMGELGERLHDLHGEFVQLRDDYASLEVEEIYLDECGDPVTAATAVDALRATLGEVTYALLLAEVDQDIVQRYSSRLKPHTRAA